MAHGQTIRSTNGIQQLLIVPTRATRLTPHEPKGVVYTKGWVVQLLLDLSGYRADKNLVDSLAVEPAAGDGAFLGPIIERLLDCCRRLNRSFSECRNSLIAYELDEESAQRSRKLVVGILEERGINRRLAQELAESWVRAADYLLDAPTMEADFVIGNPPYIRLEDIPDEVIELYRNAYPTMRGRADLYVAFFEAALRQLKSGGVCAFICADRWMRNQYGAKLRELVTSGFAVEVMIEMHDADAFHDEVDAYPAITVIRRKRQAAAVVARAGSEAEAVPFGVLSSAIRAVARGENPMAPACLRMARVHTWFEGSSPWPCHSPEQLALLRELEDRFPGLEAYARVGIGVATGNDAVFITEDANLVERSRLLKIALVGDISQGRMQWSGHYLVDPWNSRGLVDLEKYPRLRAYFEHHAAALKKRHTALKNAQGWYKTIDRITHSLTGKPKLYIADIKDVLNPVLDQRETYPHHNLYFIESDAWDLEVLGGLLMSALGQFFVESYGVRMRGGYLRFQAQYLRRIRVPAPAVLSKAHSQELREAFRDRDRQRATHASLQVYGIRATRLEAALGHQ